MKRGKQIFLPFSTALNRGDRTLATVQNYALSQSFNISLRQGTSSESKSRTDQDYSQGAHQGCSRWENKNEILENSVKRLVD